VLKLQTERLRLIALTLEQLSLYRTAPQRLEQELGFPISRSNITPQARRAIEIKTSKMIAV